MLLHILVIANLTLIQRRGNGNPECLRYLGSFCRRIQHIISTPAVFSVFSFSLLRHHCPGRSFAGWKVFYCQSKRGRRRPLRRWLVSQDVEYHAIRLIVLDSLDLLRVCCASSATVANSSIAPYSFVLIASPFPRPGNLRSVSELRLSHLLSCLFLLIIIIITSQSH